MTNEKTKRLEIRSELTFNDTCAMGNYMPYEVREVDDFGGHGLSSERYRVDVTLVNIGRENHPKVCYALNENPQNQWGLYEIRIVDFNRTLKSWIYGWGYELNAAHKLGRKVALDLALKVSKNEGLPIIDRIDSDIERLRREIKEFDKKWENDSRHPKNNFRDGEGI